MQIEVLHVLDFQKIVPDWFDWIIESRSSTDCLSDRILEMLLALSCS